MVDRLIGVLNLFREGLAIKLPSREYDSIVLTVKRFKSINHSDVISA